MLKPMMMVVRQRRAVLRNTFSFFMVTQMPQKQAATRATMKNAAPTLYGRPRTFTKKRST